MLTSSTEQEAAHHAGLRGARNAFLHTPVKEQKEGGRNGLKNLAGSAALAGTTRILRASTFTT